MRAAVRVSSPRRCRRLRVGDLPDASGPWVASLADVPRGRGAAAVRLRPARGAHYYHPQRLDAARCAATSGSACTTIPYVNVGLQDITAWVDFTRVAEAGVAAGLEVAGFATQAAFLLATGLEQLVGEAADDLQRARLAGEARRLVMPEEMGEAFKVMALTRALNGAARRLRAAGPARPAVTRTRAAGGR